MRAWATAWVCVRFPDGRAWRLDFGTWKEARRAAARWHRAARVLGAELDLWLTRPR